MSIAPKVLSLMIATPTAIGLAFLTPGASPAHIALATQLMVNFALQNLFQAATHDLPNLLVDGCAQFRNIVRMIFFRHLQNQLPNGYNRHDLISCGL
jgi:hypothetical protein